MSSRKIIVFVIATVLILMLSTFSTKIVLADQNNTVSTDYPAYVKNDTVSISGTFSPPNAVMLSIMITNPNGVSRLWQTNGESDGRFQTSYPLTENSWLVPGIYQLNVQYGTQNMSSTKFVYISNDSIKIPTEMKNVTAQWVLDKINDTTFVENIQYYANTGLLRIPDTLSGESHASEPIPQWVHANSRMWLQGSNNAVFAKGLHYLYYADYLPTELASNFQPLQELASEKSTSVSNTNVTLSAVNGTKVIDGQVIELKGKITEQVRQTSIGIPNALFSIVDADNGKEIGNGTTDNFGAFHFSWIVNSSSKTTRNLIGVYHGNKQLQPSQSPVLTFQILPPVSIPSINSGNKTINSQKEVSSAINTSSSSGQPNSVVPPKELSPVASPTSQPSQPVPPTSQSNTPIVKSNQPPSQYNPPENPPSMQNQSSGYDYSSMVIALVVIGIIIAIGAFAYRMSRQRAADESARQQQEQRQRESYQKQQREEYERRQREEYNQSRQQNQKQSGSRREGRAQETRDYSDKIKMYYTILGLESGATKEQVKERYRELTKMVHPDKHQGSETSTDMMKKYNEAYNAIMDALG